MHDQLVDQDIGDCMEARTVLMQEPRLSIQTKLHAVILETSVIEENQHVNNI